MSRGPVVDLYGGMGDSLALLSHALQAHRGAKLVTFERDQQRQQRRSIWLCLRLDGLVARLQEHSDVHVVDARALMRGVLDMPLGPIKSYRHQTSCPAPRSSDEVQSFLVAASTRDPAVDGVLLDVVCDSLKETKP